MSEKITAALIAELKEQYEASRAFGIGWLDATDPFNVKIDGDVNVNASAIAATRAVENDVLERAAQALEAAAEPGDEDEELSVSGMREMHCATIRSLKHAETANVSGAVTGAVAEPSDTKEPPND